MLTVDSGSAAERVQRRPALIVRRDQCGPGLQVRHGVQGRALGDRVPYRGQHRRVLAEELRAGAATGRLLLVGPGEAQQPGTHEHQLLGDPFDDVHGDPVSVERGAGASHQPSRIELRRLEGVVDGAAGLSGQARQFVAAPAPVPGLIVVGRPVAQPGDHVVEQRDHRLAVRADCVFGAAIAQRRGDQQVGADRDARAQQDHGREVTDQHQRRRARVGHRHHAVGEDSGDRDVEALTAESIPATDQHARQEDEREEPQAGTPRQRDGADQSDPDEHRCGVVNCLLHRLGDGLLHQQHCGERGERRVAGVEHIGGQRPRDRSGDHGLDQHQRVVGAHRHTGEHRAHPSGEPSRKTTDHRAFLPVAVDHRTVMGFFPLPTRLKRRATWGVYNLQV